MELHDDPACKQSSCQAGHTDIGTRRAADNHNVCEIGFIVPGGRKTLQIGGTTQSSRGGRGGSATPSTGGSSIMGSQPETRQAASNPTSVGSQTQQQIAQPQVSQPQRAQVQQVQPQSQPQTNQPQPETRNAASDPTSVGSQPQQRNIQPQVSQPVQGQVQQVQPQVSQPQQFQPQESGTAGTTPGGTRSSSIGQPASTIGTSSGLFTRHSSLESEKKQVAEAHRACLRV